MSSTGSSFEFDEFVLDTGEKILLRDGDVVPITPKVFELLLVLVENHGHIVEKDKLMDRVWANSFVEDSNLTFTVRQLRKVLGDDTQNPRFIETVPKRGYRFIAKTVERVAAAEATPDLHSPVDTPAAKSNSSINGFQKSEPFRRYIFLAGFLLIFGAVGVTIYSFWSKAGTSAGSGNVKIQRLTSNGKTKVAAISPDGKFLAYVAGDEGSQSLWLRNIAAGGDLEVLPATGKDDQQHRVLPRWKLSLLHFGRRALSIAGPGRYAENNSVKIWGFVFILPRRRTNCFSAVPLRGRRNRRSDRRRHGRQRRESGCFQQAPEYLSTVSGVVTRWKSYRVHGDDRRGKSGSGDGSRY
jgi:DNA-binding winged helix-turn-helix (wHTH) protein